MRRFPAVMLLNCALTALSYRLDFALRRPRPTVFDESCQVHKTRSASALLELDALACLGSLFITLKAAAASGKSSPRHQRQIQGAAETSTPYSHSLLRLETPSQRQSTRRTLTSTSLQMLGQPGKILDERY